MIFVIYSERTKKLKTGEWVNDKTHDLAVCLTFNVII